MANKLLQSLKFPGLSDTYLIPLMKNFAPAYSSISTYVVGDYCSHDNKFYVCKTAISTAEAWTAGHWDEVSVADIATAIGEELTDLKEALTTVSTTLTTKADKDGTVASAEQLLSDVGTEDKAPYLLRAVPYDSTRVDEEVVGCSVGWNQLVQNGNFADGTSKWSSWNGTIAASDGILTLTATSPELSIYASNGNVSIVSGHKYLIRAKVKPSVNTSGTKLAYTTSGSSIKTVACIANAWTDIETVFNATSNTNIIMVYLDNLSAKAVGDTLQIREVMLIDLTSWFGSAIADYAYTLEQATAGSGIAWLKSYGYFTAPYYPYSAPTLKSVSGLSAHVMRGFNQWDEEWEVGSLNTSTGEKTSGSSLIRSKNYIPIIPSTAYYINVNCVICFYDKNKTYIGYSEQNKSVFETPTNASYMLFRTAATYGEAYKYDICLNVSDPARNGQYEPYKETTYPLDSDLTLRGILKMDSDHNVYADGDVYESDGTVTRRYGVVDLGNYTWTYRTDTAVPIFEANISGAKATSSGDIVGNILCGKYVTVTSNKISQSGYDKCIAKSANQGRIYVQDSAYTDGTTFKTAMSGVYLVYELATPTTETADPYTSPQNCAPGGTEEYVYAEGGSGIPVGHNSKYLKNMRSELERVSVAVPDAPSNAGTYSLKATVTAQGVTYGWVAE